MCIDYQRRAESATIEESAVKEGADFEKDGYWFKVHFVKGEEVYFIKGRSGESEAFAARRMPVAEFVKQFNRGKVDGKETL
jgi:hypothetical protein